MFSLFYPALEYSVKIMLYFILVRLSDSLYYASVGQDYKCKNHLESRFYPLSQPQPPNKCMEAVIDHVMLPCYLAH